jgi:hypothetical protein
LSRDQITSIGVKSLWEADPENQGGIPTNQKLISAVVPLGQDNTWETQLEFTSQGSLSQEIEQGNAQINFHNTTQNPLYVTAITISTHGKLSVLYPQGKISPLGSNSKSLAKGYPIKGKGLVEIIVFALEGMGQASNFVEELRKISTKPGSEVRGQQSIDFAISFLRSLDSQTRSTRTISSQDKAVDLKDIIYTSHRINIKSIA